MNIETLKHQNLVPVLLATFLLVVYVLGIIFPDFLWTTHFWSFIPTFLKVTGLFIILSLFCFAQFGSFKIQKPFFSLTKTSLVFLSIIMGVGFYYLNITNDYYGDAKNFTPLLNQKTTSLPLNFWNELLSIQFKTGHARWGVFNLYSLFSYIFDLSIKQIFVLADAIFGASFIFIWGLIIKRFITDHWLQVCFIILGITTPVLLIFCGHIETYAFILFFLISWLYLYLIAFKTKSIALFLILIPLLVIGVRFNTVLIFLTPALLLGLIYNLGIKSVVVTRFFTLKKIFFYILIPSVILLSSIYLFVLKDYNDSRILIDSTKDIDRLFLPLFSPESPLHNYNLFSWNHIIDFLQVFFLWSPVLLFFIAIAFIYGKKSNYNTPLISILTLTLGFFLGFLFMINPLMSLPMDWDLYCLPFPIALIILVLIFETIDLKLSKPKIMLLTIGISLLSIPSFVVLFNKKMHSYRIESVGVRVFKTYYQHSGSYLLYALQMLEDHDLYKKRKIRLIQKLKPHVNYPYDKTFADLLLDEGVNAYINKEYENSRNFLLSSLIYEPKTKLTQEFIKKTNYALFSKGYIPPKRHIESADSLVTMGLYSSKSMKLHNKALTDFERAIYYNPRNPRISMGQMEVFFGQKKFNKAFSAAKQLIKFRYPSEKQSIRIGIHCALEATAYQEALQFSKTYISKWPEDKLIQDIYTALLNNSNVSKLKYKFAQQ